MPLPAKRGKIKEISPWPYHILLEVDRVDITIWCDGTTPGLFNWLSQAFFKASRLNMVGLAEKEKRNKKKRGDPTKNYIVEGQLIRQTKTVDFYRIKESKTWGLAQPKLKSHMNQKKEIQTVGIYDFSIETEKCISQTQTLRIYQDQRKREIPERRDETKKEIETSQVASSP